MEENDKILRAKVQQIYTPLHVAKKEIQRRWLDKKLRKKVQDYLGGNIPSPFKKEPRAILSRNIITPNIELSYFLDLAKISKLKPAGFEGAEDKFCTKNSDKVSLGKLSFMKKTDKNKPGHEKQGNFNLNVIDMQSSDGKKFSDIKTFWGESLVDFHHKMLAAYGSKIEIFDDFKWFSERGKRSNPKQYYENFLVLFLCYGILFENFHANGKETEFTSEIILKNLQKIEAEFGLKPLIVPLVPIEEEKCLFCWNSYFIK